MTQPMSGLFVRPPVPDAPHAPTHPRPVPLLGVSVEAELTGPSARVVLAQRFKNVEAHPIEAVYLFPLPTDAAVAGFSAEVDGRLIEGRVEARDKAFEIYDDAMADGHGAFLLDQERPNVFTVSVGHLRPGSEAIIRITWVAPCAFEGQAVRFQLPTTVSPRYTPPSTAPEVGQPDADKLDPERRSKVPYGLHLRVAIDGALRRVESPTHPIRTTLGTPSLVELAQDATALDRDVVLLVEPADAHNPAARVARDEAGARYVQVAFAPDVPAAEGGAEIVFLVDCSGSMAGDSIAEARRALELCVRALDPRDTFDIVRFGSTHEALFGAARALDAASFEAAIAYARATDAGLGGTEILAPLAAIIARPRAPGRARQILLLTDGQVSNEADVIELARQHADAVRVFAFGIGAGVSEHLVREVARATRGEVEMIAPGERIEPKVLRQFGRARTPALADVRVDWGGLEVEQAPRNVPPVFAGELLTVWARVRVGSATEAVLTAGDRRWTVPLDLEHAASGGPIPLLWGRAAIADLERDTGRHGSSQARPGREARKDERLVELGRAFGLLSSATSYVAVELRAEADRVTGPSELRRVPIALTAGWGGHPALSTHAQPLARSRHAPGGAPPSPQLAAAPARHMKRMARPSAAAGAGMDPAPRDALASPPPPPPLRSARPASPSAAPATTDPLYTLLLTQAFDGSFPMTAALRATASDPDRLATLIAQHGEAKVATSLVLALLARDFLDRQLEWRPAADKARRFLQGEPLAEVTALVP